jgi:Protein of unknown function (DUF3054)
MSRFVSPPDPPVETDRLSRTVPNQIPRAAESRWLGTGLLIAGDAVSFLTFAAVGLQSHHDSANLFWTASPFAAGWFLVAPFLGAFTRPLTTGIGRMLRRTEISWLAAWPVTLVLRWALSADHNVPLSFALVILVANGLFLGIWRGLYATFAGWLGRRG